MGSIYTNFVEKKKQQTYTCVHKVEPNKQTFVNGDFWSFFEFTVERVHAFISLFIPDGI